MLMKNMKAFISNLVFTIIAKTVFLVFEILNVYYTIKWRITGRFAQITRFFPDIDKAVFGSYKIKGQDQAA